MTQEEKDTADFNNSILIDKRPYFMRYLYPHYDKKHQKHKDIYDTIAIAKFGVNMDDLLAKKDRMPEEQSVVDIYNERGFFVNTDCVMNRICWHMEKSVKENRVKLAGSVDDVHNLLIDKDVKIDQDKLKKMEVLFKEYKSNKKNSTGDASVLLSQYVDYIRSKAHEISSMGLN